MPETMFLRPTCREGWSKYTSHFPTLAGVT